MTEERLKRVKFRGESITGGRDVTVYFWRNAHGTCYIGAGDGLLRSGNLAGDERKSIEECIEHLADAIEHIIMKEDPDV